MMNLASGLGPEPQKDWSKKIFFEIGSASFGV